MIRIGIMGCGAVADFGHAPAIVENPGFQLAAVYDPAEERANAFASKFGAPVAAANTSEFFAAGLQAVVIASPPGAHYDNAVAAADHGCH